MLTVIQATSNELATIADFQCAMALETEDLVLDRPTVMAGVRGVFDVPSRGFYLLARREDAVCGSLLVLSEWSDWRAREVWWLHSVYVVPAERAHGVFRAMFNEVERLARARDVAGLRLYVDRRNARAKQVYRALGMSDEHYELFERLWV